MGAVAPSRWLPIGQRSTGGSGFIGGGYVIVLVNAQVCRPPNRRFPLSLMSLGAALPPERSWEIVDGRFATTCTPSRPRYRWPGSWASDSGSGWT